MQARRQIGSSPAVVSCSCLNHGGAETLRHRCMHAPLWHAPPAGRTGPEGPPYRYVYSANYRLRLPYAGRHPCSPEEVRTLEFRAYSCHLQQRRWTENKNISPGSTLLLLAVFASRRSASLSSQRLLERTPTARHARHKLEGLYPALFLRPRAGGDVRDLLHHLQKTESR